jgi:adenylate cyclase
LRNKAIFIGLSDPFQTEQKDYYLTPFSSSEGPDVSGVEIAATVFANLLDRGGLRRLRPTSQAVLLGLWAALLAGCALRLSTGRALGAITGLGLVYFAGAVQLFARQALWLPVAAPLLAMVPPALGATVIGHIRQVRRERRQIQDAVGFYLPAQAVAELVDPQRAIGERWQVARGVCMATDAAQYSHLAERMPPEALSRLMNRYYEALFRPIRARGGMISDIVGDAMMALWACPPAPSVDRHSACLAALEVLEAVADFNRAHADVTLPTRIGLHCGELVLGNVGAMDHYEYRAVGDVVNSASRLEGLNKSFGTRLLCSREMIEGLEDLLTRPLGNVLLAGKTRQLEVCELMGRRGTARPAQRLLCQRFGAALDAYSRRDWSRAAERFRQCLELHPDDGPSLYYLDVITNQRQDLRAGLVPGPEAMRAVHPIKHH